MPKIGSWRELCAGPVVSMRKLISFLIIAFFAARGLVPAGYMPAFSAEGALQLVICSASGAHSIPFDGNGAPAQQNFAKGDYCAFAASAPVAAGGHAIAFPFPRLRLANIPQPCLPQTSLSAKFDSPAQPRAPPAIKA